VFIGLINNYLVCYKDVKSEHLTAKEIFEFKKYLSIFDKRKRKFMTELCKTQSFNYFIERSYRAKEERNELFFFTEGIRMCVTKSNKALTAHIKKITEQLLHKNKNVFIHIKN
jgi:hypothetical protein